MAKQTGTAIAKIQTSQIPSKYNPEEIKLIKDTVAKGATDLELKMFLSQCQRTGLDALTRQIYFSVKEKKDKQGRIDRKVQIQTSIDGFRLIAERSGKYEGQTKPEWCGIDGTWKDIWISPVPPKAARIGVYKQGFKEPLYAVAIFDEYAQKNYEGQLQFMWKKMPSLMISKVAESLALRKAFPNEMSGIYTTEELPPEHTEPEKESNKVELKTVDAGEKIVSKAIETFGGTVEDPKKQKQKDTLQRLVNMLNAMGMHGRTQESLKKRRTLLESVFGTYSGPALAMLPTAQIEDGIKIIKDSLDPADDGPFPPDPIDMPDDLNMREPGGEG